MRIGYNLRRAIDSANYSYLQLYLLSGVSDSLIARICNGNGCRIVDMIRIAIALGCPVDELLEGSSDKYSAADRNLLRCLTVGHADTAACTKMDDRQINTNISHTIGRLRCEKRMSQSELAHKLGISRQTVNEMESAKHMLTCERIIMTCKALDVPISTVLPSINVVPNREAALHHALMMINNRQQ